MDLGTIVGLTLGSIFIIISVFITGANPLVYIDVGSIMVTVGGSFCAMIISNPLQRVIGMGRFIRFAFFVPRYETEKIISTLVNFSEKARREGLLALEDDLEELDDEFMRNGIQLVVDGTDPEIIKNILFTELNRIQERHSDAIKFCDDWSKFAPAWGMLGTLLGLVAMLQNLGGDKSIIGKGMGLALITSLYGAIMCYLWFLPFRNKLMDRDRMETLMKEIMVEGILSIQSGDNPRILEQKLLSFLPPVQRETVRAESANE
jgi:chemotaxis protein MotA